MHFVANSTTDARDNSGIRGSCALACVDMQRYMPTAVFGYGINTAELEKGYCCASGFDLYNGRRIWSIVVRSERRSLQPIKLLTFKPGPKPLDLYS